MSPPFTNFPAEAEKLQKMSDYLLCVRSARGLCVLLVLIGALMFFYGFAAREWNWTLTGAALASGGFLLEQFPSWLSFLAEAFLWLMGGMAVFLALVMGLGYRSVGLAGLWFGIILDAAIVARVYTCVSSYKHFKGRPLEKTTREISRWINGFRREATRRKNKNLTGPGLLEMKTPGGARLCDVWFSQGEAVLVRRNRDELFFARKDEVVLSRSSQASGKSGLRARVRFGTLDLDAVIPPGTFEAYEAWKRLPRQPAASA